jgi:hypothetical protein
MKKQFEEFTTISVKIYIFIEELITISSKMSGKQFENLITISAKRS